MSAPPQKGAESIQVGRYLKYLTNSFNLELVTSNTPNHSWVRKDNSIAKNNITQNRIELNIYKGRVLSKIESIYKNSTHDERFANYFKKAIKKISHKPNIIYSRALPHSSTLLAKKLKEHFDVPWIMHLSDPWEDNTFESTAKNNKSLEKSCISSATIITLTSELAVKFYKDKYPEHNNKFVLMPNVFDEEFIYKKHATHTSKYLTITHTGNFYGKRNPETILQVLRQLSIENKLQNAKFYFAGEMDETTKLLFQKYSIPEVILLGGITFEESITLQQQSDVLLLIDKEYEKPVDLTTLPSKLLDYCATTKPILAITPKGSSTEKFIHKHAAGKSFEHSQLAEIKNYIMSLINDIKNKGSFQKCHPPKEYGAKYNVARLKEICSQIA